MRGKTARYKTVFFQSPCGLLPEDRFVAKTHPSPVSLIMSQRIRLYFTPRCLFSLSQHVCRTFYPFFYALP